MPSGRKNIGKEENGPAIKSEKLRMAKKMGIPKCALRLVDMKLDDKKSVRVMKKKLELRKDIREMKSKLRDLKVKHHDLSTPGKLELGPKQLKMVQLLCDFEHNYNIDQVCEILQISRGTYHKWKNTLLFQRELNKELTKRKNAVRREALSHVFKRVRRGDIRTIFKYLEMTGDMNENITLNVNESSEKDMSDESLDSEISRLYEELGEDNVH